MNWQEIIVGLLAILAVFYIIRFFLKLNKEHKCDDCGLMDLKKEKDRINQKLNS